MRITLDLNDELLNALIAIHPELSKMRDFEQAVQAYLQETAIDRLRKLAGSLDLQDLSGDLRRLDRHT